MIKLTTIILILLITINCFADDKDRIIEESRAVYKNTGDPCPCPFDRASNNSKCGGRSAYSKRIEQRKLGIILHPYCYKEDLTEAIVKEWDKSGRYKKIGKK